MRQIIAVCRSSGAARPKAAAALDRYLWRIGDRTWRGAASNACLERICRDVRKDASKATSVALYEVRTTARSERPLLIIGSRKRFMSDGLAPIFTHSQAPHSEIHPSACLLQEAILLAALWHDIGKATKGFQDKLHLALTSNERRGEPLRHEVYSALAFDAFAGDLSDRALAARLAEITPADVDASCAVATELARHLAQSGADATIVIQSIATRPESLSAAIAGLVLTHHRLADAKDNLKDFVLTHHFNEKSPFYRGLFDIAPGARPWASDSWLKACQRSGVRIGDHLKSLDKINTKAGLCVSDDASLRGLESFGRTALMFADHIGSKRRQTSDLAAGILYANTIEVEGKAHIADTLETHVRRVYDATRATTRMLLRDESLMPGLTRDMVPTSILEPSPDDERFRWQADGAAIAAKLSASGPGGMFLCVMSGTGSGKTRGAPTILTAAAMADPEESHRRLRYNLCLGLRTLAYQSGREYVEDLGFSSGSVVTLAGGVEINWRNVVDDASGSEDRLSVMDNVSADHPNASIPADGEEDPAWIASLAGHQAADLPPILESALEGERNAASFRRLVATPILSATIDNFMPAADAQRSRHLPAMLRVLTADTIIDEVDLFNEEDMSAITRLCYLVGIGGRRLIIMSATLTEDIATAFHDAYRHGYKDRTRIFGGSETVHYAVIADAPGAIASSLEQQPVFEKAFRRVRDCVIDALATRPPMRRIEILRKAHNWSSVVSEISTACDRMHQRHKTQIDDFSVSVGLVRLTRIKHLHALATALPAKPGIHRELVILHSRMPFARRNLVENELKGALTRKGDRPDAGLAAWLRARGVFDRAAAAGAEQVSVVVLSSPVIETGNDLDFDYAVIDPSSLRAIIQTAGRVNRHRQLSISAANVAVLHRPLVAMETGFIQKPGVETKPAGATLVAQVKLGVDRNLDALIDMAGLDAIDARMMIDPMIASAWRDGETALRAAFFAKPATTLGYDDSVTMRLSTLGPRRRRFRRPTEPMVTIWPSMNPLSSTSWMCLDPKSKKPLPLSGVRKWRPSCSLPIIYDMEDSDVALLTEAGTSFMAKRPHIYFSLDIATSTLDKVIYDGGCFGLVTNSVNELDDPLMKIIQ